MELKKKKVGPPEKPEEERQVPFTVSCKKKNLETIRPKVKAFIKKLDK